MVVRGAWCARAGVAGAWCGGADQLRDHTGKKQKAEMLARFKGSNARSGSAPFFLGCALAPGTCKRHLLPLEDFRATKLVVLLSTCERESGSGSG